jgi:hypothetical protein
VLMSTPSLNIWLETGSSCMDECLLATSLHICTDMCYRPTPTIKQTPFDMPLQTTAITFSGGSYTPLPPEENSSFGLFPGHFLVNLWTLYTVTVT